MPCSPYLNELAQFVYQEIGQPTDITSSYVQSRLISNVYLGKLNSKIDECFSVVSGDISPKLSADQQAIYAEMYKADYYGKKAITSLPLNAGSTAWTSISEGDTKISLSDPNKISASYRILAKDAQENLTSLIDSYKINRSNPASVDYLNPSFPNMNGDENPRNGNNI